jgi:hypothetical protein
MAHPEVDAHLHAHAKAIDDLHHKLAATAGADKEKLQVAVTKLKVSYTQFVEDAKGCMN